MRRVNPWKWFTLSALGVSSAVLTFAESRLPEPSGRPLLSVSGAIDKTHDGVQARLDLAYLDSLEQTEFVTSTPWVDEKRRFSGVLLRDLLRSLDAQPNSIQVIALNDYIIDVPALMYLEKPMLLATRIDGKALRIRDRGPTLLIFPFDAAPEFISEAFYIRSVWQLKEIIVEAK